MLLDAAMKLLDERDAAHITMPEVAATAGLDDGQIGDDFADVDDLMDHAIVHRFSRHVDDAAAAISGILAASNTVDEARMLLQGVTRFTQTTGRSVQRMQRIEAIARTRTSARLRAMIASEQHRLNRSYAELVVTFKERGWLREQVDPLALGLFLQAYTLGRVLDDISEERVDAEAWNRLIDIVMDSLLPVD